MEEFMHELRIPKERVAVIIGKDGEIKKEIERATKTSIDIDSNEGEVFIKGPDGLGIFNALEVIKAIGRGFNPDIARMLLKTDFIFEIMSIADYTGKSQNSVRRLKGRVIGAEGKSRRMIEELSECHISVYGKTISMLGTAESVAIARHAVDSLLNGSPHSNVYRWLERKRRELKRRDIRGLKASEQRVPEEA